MFKWKLSACRVQAGLYQREAAKALGISEVSLVNYEKGKSSPDMDLGQKMSELYGVPMDMMDFTKVGNRVIKDQRRISGMSKDLDVNKLMDNVKALTVENENLLRENEGV